MKDQRYLNYYISGIIIFFLVTNNFISADFQENNLIDKESVSNTLDHQSTEQESLLDTAEELDEDELLRLEDEKFYQEILEVVAHSYKDVIDLSALYFCGLIDWDKLYDQLRTLIHKDVFKIIKIFSWYVPALLKNKKISTYTKIKKSMYVTSSVVILWFIYKEIFPRKDTSRGIKFESDFTEFNHRHRPNLNL